MSSRTWIDNASDWVTGYFASRNADTSFTPEQTLILKLAFEECFKTFATQLAGQLCDRFNGIEEEILNVKASMEKSKFRDACVDQIEVATMPWEETSSNRRTIQRRLRRKRARTKYVYHRDALLQLYPLLRMDDDVVGASQPSEECLVSVCHVSKPVPREAQVSEDFVAHQHLCAKVLQRWWRRRRNSLVDDELVTCKSCVGMLMIKTNKLRKVWPRMILFGPTWTIISPMLHRLSKMNGHGVLSMPSPPL